MTAAALMLGSAAVSAGCCAAPRADASHLARVLAVAMLAVMVAVTLDVAPVVQGVGALLLLALAGWLAGGTTGRGSEVAWHRAVGVALMALAVLMPQHGGSMGASQATDHSLLVLLLRAATVAYLCWVAAALVRLRNRPFTDLLRWEHLAMGASLAVMIFFMN